MALTVGFDATAAARQAAGIGRYTRNLLSALAARQDDIRYRLYYCGAGRLNGSLPSLDDRFRIRRLPVSDRLMNAVWHRAQARLPVQIITGGFDLFHSPDFSLPPLGRRPSVLTIHDLAFLTVPNCAYPTLAAYLKEVVPRSARRATHIIAVSESTRRDVISLLGVAEEQVSTVLEGVDPTFRPMPAADASRTLRRLGIEQPFILSVGTLEPRKNYVSLLEVYARLRQRGLPHLLVIAGRRGWMYEPIFRRLRDLSLQDSVRFVAPDDETLAALYGRADAFVFPSLYEGFGIPPLEALACGAAVACSNSSSLPEVVGNAALTFAPLDRDAMEDAIWRLVSDKSLNAMLRRQGPEQAERFSWKSAAEKTVDVYRDVMRSG